MSNANSNDSNRDFAERLLGGVLTRFHALPRAGRWAVLAGVAFGGFALLNNVLWPIADRINGRADRLEVVLKRAADRAEGLPDDLAEAVLAHGPNSVPRSETDGKEKLAAAIAEILKKKGVKPKAAVVMIGTNNSNGEDNTVSQIAEGVSAIVAKLRQALPDTKVLLVGIFPRGESPNPQRGKVLQVNQVLSRLADGKSVFWIDFGSRYVDAQGLIPRDLMPDYLHLSPAAYQIWADELEAPLVRIAGVTPLGTSAAPPSPAKAAEGLTGKWKFTTPGPDGQPVTFPMELTQSGNRITGRFSRGGDRWLQIENGKVEGNEFSWTVKRDRPDGQSMIYQMSGKVAGGELAGSAKASMDGNDITTSWTARRE